MHKQINNLQNSKFKNSTAVNNNNTLIVKQINNLILNLLNTKIFFDYYYDFRNTTSKRKILGKKRRFYYVMYLFSYLFSMFLFIGNLCFFFAIKFNLINVNIDYSTNVILYIFKVSSLLLIFTIFFSLLNKAILNFMLKNLNRIIRNNEYYMKGTPFFFLDISFLILIYFLVIN
jgi:hypothetical protein